MKKMKKLFAMILSLAMVLGMSLTTFAKPQENDNIPRSGDTVDVTITNIKDGATVTLYKILNAEYAENGIGLTGYTPVTGVNLDSLKTNPTSVTINDIANKIVKGDIVPSATIGMSDQGVKLENGTYTANVAAGAYIAIINKSTDGTIYNPILLTAAYAPEKGTNVELSQLVGGSVSTTDRYMNGATAVAKSTEPGFDKVIKSGTTEDVNTDGKTILTASIGDVIEFELQPTVPNYPSNAVNKTFFFSDTMDEGFTFDYDSLTITLHEEGAPVVTRDGNTFKIGDTVIAEALNTTADNIGSFRIAFKYDGLLISNGDGAVYTPYISYKAVVNKKATIGEDANTNTAYMYYANQSNSGDSYDTPDEEPDPQKDKTISRDEDEEKVYTYRLAFLKTDDVATNPTPLAGAVFGIYADGKLVDEVVTNDSGYAESTVVKAGTYTVKELIAPEGYTLSEKEYTITANWSTATTVINSSVTNCEYTSVKSESLDGVQVGWLKDNKFYAMDEYEAATNEVVPAYVKESNRTTTTATTVETNPKEGAGVSLLASAIPNTKLASLPSTGGIGTTIFTIGGCVIMIVAAGLFFASRRKSSAK